MNKSTNNLLDEEISQIIITIKNDIIDTRRKIFENANSQLIALYFKIGRHISENLKYGNQFIINLSESLKLEFPNAKGYSPRNLARMRKFYEEYRDFSILPPLVAKLPWTHNCILIDKISDRDIRFWYANKTLENGWSKIILEHQIELDLYSRQSSKDNKLTNFINLLPDAQGELASDLIKDPYIFELTGIKERITEKELEDKIIDNIKNVLLELGKGFSFVGNQYKISADNKDYFIDLLFYHLDLRCYIVVELKNTDFDPAFMGQLQFYVTAVDETLKKDSDDPTIGLLLCKKKDKLSVEWSLKSSKVPVGVASYEIRNLLPTEEEINELFNK